MSGHPAARPGRAPFALILAFLAAALPGNGHGSIDLMAKVNVELVARPAADGVRATNPSFQTAVDDRLLRELERRGIEVVRLDPGARASWLDEVESLVWDRLKPPQLRLV